MTLKSVANMLVHNIFEGIYQNFDLFLAKCSNFNMSMVEWVEIIKILIISRSSFSDFDQINIGRITFDLFYQNFDKIYQSVTCNQLKIHQ